MLMLSACQKLHVYVVIVLVIWLRMAMEQDEGRWANLYLPCHLYGMETHTRQSKTWKVISMEW